MVFSMGTLQDYQTKVLNAICDTFFGPVDSQGEKLLLENTVNGSEEQKIRKEFGMRKATDFGVPEKIVYATSAALPPWGQLSLSLFLFLLSSRIAMFFLCFRFKPFYELDQRDREYVMINWFRESWIGLKRKAFHTFKGLTMSIAFSIEEEEGKANNINWSAVQYEGPESKEEIENFVGENSDRKEFVFSPINSIGQHIYEDFQIINDYDVIVIGSGCGGSVVASELSSLEGTKVVVLEKAKYYPRSEMTGSEKDGFEKYYEHGGLQVTADSNITVFSGSALGGGSFINWACCLRLPSYVRKEWSEKFGLKFFASKDFDDAMDSVSARLQVKQEGIQHNTANAKFMEGCKNLGYEISSAGQNYKDVGESRGAGFVGAGDLYGNKFSMNESYLQDAVKNGTDILDQCYVKKVLVNENNEAIGVACDIIIVNDNKEEKLISNIQILAKKVVVSAGGIHSAALLLRSQIPALNTSGELGRNLRLHPVSCAVGVLDEDVEFWKGKPMSSVCNEFARGPNNDGYGCKLELPCLHASVFAASLPWNGINQCKFLLTKAKKAISIIALNRDFNSGAVGLDSLGNPKLFYQLGQNESESLLEGVIGGLRILENLGAKWIGTSQYCEDKIMELPSVGTPDRKLKFEEFVEGVRKFGINSHDSSSLLFSAHQMGTCRMGTNQYNSVVKQTGETHGVKGLYVCDTSVFPTSSGSNPMLTVLSIATIIAKGLKNELNNEDHFINL